MQSTPSLQSLPSGPARRGRPRGSGPAEVLSVAREMFLANGYAGTTMDAVAAAAHISKQSVYRDYVSKDALYAAVVRDWVDRGFDAMRPHANDLAHTEDARVGLLRLARILQAGLLSPAVLQMRTLIAAQANQFPDVAADYVTRSWTRNIHNLAEALRALADRGLLHLDNADLAADLAADPAADLAAEQLTWLVVAAPLNWLTLQAGAHPWPDDQLHALAEQGVDTFLSRYGTDHR